MRGPWGELASKRLCGGPMLLTMISISQPCLRNKLEHLTTMHVSCHSCILSLAFNTLQNIIFLHLKKILWKIKLRPSHPQASQLSPLSTKTNRPNPATTKSDANSKRCRHRRRKSRGLFAPLDVAVELHEFLPGDLSIWVAVHGLSFADRLLLCFWRGGWEVEKTWKNWQMKAYSIEYRYRCVGRWNLKGFWVFWWPFVTKHMSVFGGFGQLAALKWLFVCKNTQVSAANSWTYLEHCFSGAISAPGKEKATRKNSDKHKTTTKAPNKTTPKHPSKETSETWNLAQNQSFPKPSYIEITQKNASHKASTWKSFSISSLEPSSCQGKSTEDPVGVLFCAISWVLEHKVQ